MKDQVEVLLSQGLGLVDQCACRGTDSLVARHVRKRRNEIRQYQRRDWAARKMPTLRDRARQPATEKAPSAGDEHLHRFRIINRHSILSLSSPATSPLRMTTWRTP